ncbi:MAG: FMN-binding protein [Phycisphaerae bacterium]|nr:FMN-binding protein [Phycisphaerae bacterium]NIP50637.1 FMN-binding protein [Phycisphaerae bacterium]NIS49769.1 FMN-binding protein [Phycisphaerae bacterium]NIU07526.1 FMN-binding protein [Phycisphaerae bacterium]NIU55118.1 FMN-binding protein [Phycisphaerae bacterium]
MIRNKSWFPILYMFCVTAVFSSIVIGFTRLTSERVEANQMLAFEKAVLSVLPGLYEEKPGRLEMHKRFVESVGEPDAFSGEAYTLKEGGKIIAYALPISGQGFWAPIKGVIGIKADGKTITGIAFYEQNETPGLGAEITKESFRNQFRGKEISDSSEPINIRRPGATLGKSDVDAITGATQTSSRVEKIINTALKKWRTEVVTK